MHRVRNFKPNGLATLPANFWKFWLGQTVSSLGSTFTIFVLPLIIFKLTNSAMNVALATGVTFLPYLFFGLIIGTYVDRLNRKRLMIFCDMVRVVLLATIGLLLINNVSVVWPLYVVMFINSTVTIGFTSAQMAAIPNLIDRTRLVQANAYLQGSYSAMTVIGPSIAAIVLSFIPIHTLLFVDSASFLISAISLFSIKASFDPQERQPPRSILKEMQEGLAYVFDHPILRNISLMTALLVFVVSSVNAQVIVFAKQQLGANDTQTGFFFTFGGIGMLIASMLAGYLKKKLSTGSLLLTVAALKGVCILLLGMMTSYPLALLLWSVSEGMSLLFSINATSLRQTIVPGHLLGRVMSISQIISWSAIPVGTFIGGVAIEQWANVGVVYTVIGFLHVIIPGVFILTPLSRADRYLSQSNIVETDVLA